MRVEHLSEGVALYLGDCREILPTLGKVDAVITDPPYGTGWTNGGGRTMGIFRSKTHRAEWDYWDDDWVTFCRAKRFSIFCPHMHLVSLIPRFDRCWLRYYIKTNPRPGLGGADAPSVEPILCAPNVKNGKSQYLTTFNGDNRYHPTEKPIPVMAWLVDGISDPGETILDPFMGSGTTGVACVKEGRDFTGIEIESKYFDIARRRISEALKQPDIFIKRVSAVEQIELAL